MHIGEVEFEFDAVIDLALARDVEHVLRFEIVAERDDLFLGAARRAQVIQRLVVHGEEAHRRAVFGRHVGDGGAVGDAATTPRLPEELDEFADDLRFAEHLRDVQREVGRGHAFAEAAGHVDADDFGCEKIDWLAEHAGFGFDAAHAPTDDAESVDHRRVRIGPDQRVGVVDAIRGQHALGEIFQIHLVDDADAGRDDLEGLERLLAPFEKLVAFAVALELHFEVLPHGLGGAEKVYLHGMVDHEIDGHERLDDLRVPFQARDDRPHCGEIDKQRHAREILQDDAGDNERDFLLRGRFGVPVGQGAHVALGHLLAVDIAQHGFEHDANADRQSRNLADTSGLQGGKGIKPSLATAAKVERLQ